ncbi:MAG: hypothetical protein ACTSQI_11340 [Candidatus Helarchaeota archaeon]
MDKKKTHIVFKRLVLISVVLIILLAMVPTTPVKAADGDGDGTDDELEKFWLTTYSPTLYFKSGENFFPVDCTYQISNSELWKWVGTNQVLEDANPTPGSIGAGYDEWHYLNSTLGDYSDIVANYSSMRAILGYTVYGRVIDESGFYAVQYWFFYLYNDHSINQHQGDWELFEVILNSTHHPVFAACSQHNNGQTAVWNDVEKTNTTHPNIYIAKGSHANYFRNYQGKAPLENDEVGNDGFKLTYMQAVSGLEKYTLTFIGENGTGDWLDFQGRWGNWVNLYDSYIGFAGPFGPAQGDNAVKWVTPVSWASSLMTVSSTWFMLSWFFYYLLEIFLGIFAILCLWKIYKVIKNRRSDEVPSLGTVLGGRAAFGVFLGFVTMAITAVIIFLPWYRVFTDVQSVVFSSQGDVILIDGWSGVQVNMLVEGTGMAPLFSILIPMYLILGTGIVLSILDILGAKSAKKLGNKYLISGTIFIVFFIIILIGLSQMNNIIGMIYGGSLPTEITDILNALSAHPFGGSTSITIGGIINVDVLWGLMLGGWLLITNAILKIFTGAVLKSTPESA